MYGRVLLMSSCMNDSYGSLDERESLRISIVVPTYRRPKMLARALASIQGQIFRDFECIIVNDSPSDRVILDELLANMEDPRFRILHNETNMGGNYCRNRGISDSKASIIAFLDDDDEWHADKLAKHNQCHKESGRPVVVYSGLVLRWEDEQRSDLCRRGKAVPLDVANAVGAGRFCPATTTSVTVDRQCFSAVGLFDELLPSLQDWDMWFRISQTFDFVVIAECLNVFHQHIGDRASINWEKRMQALDLIEEKYQDDTRVDFGRLRRTITDAAFTSNVINYAGANEYWNGLSFIFTNRKRLFRDVGCLSVLVAYLRLFSPRSFVDFLSTFRAKLAENKLKEERGLQK
jgi:glycosyltransferase involved in cell wall biosynthesis